MELPPYKRTKTLSSLTEEVPRDVLSEIMCYLDPEDVLRLVRINRVANQIFNDPNFQRDCFVPKLSDTQRLAYEIKNKYGITLRPIVHREYDNNYLEVYDTTNNFMDFKISWTIREEKDWEDRLYGTLDYEESARLGPVPHSRQWMNEMRERHFFDEIRCYGSSEFVVRDDKLSDNFVNSMVYDLVSYATRLFYKEFRAILDNYKRVDSNFYYALKNSNGITYLENAVNEDLLNIPGAVLETLNLSQE